MTGERIREVRILVRQGTQLRALSKLAFSQSEGSLYLFPYGPTGHFYFGRSSIPGGHEQATVPFADQEESPLTPKLSIHEKGQVHIKAGKRIMGPMYIPPLAKLRGEHIATVTCNRFDRLGLFERDPRTTGAERDLALSVEEGVESGRLAIYANGESPSFEARDAITVTLRRPTLASPLYLRLTPWSQLPLGEDAEGSVVLTAGWDPQNSPVSAPLDYLFIVAR